MYWPGIYLTAIALAAGGVMLWWQDRQHRNEVPQYIWWEGEPEDPDGPYEVNDENWVLACEWLDYVAGLPETDVPGVGGRPCLSADPSPTAGGRVLQRGSVRRGGKA